MTKNRDAGSGFAAAYCEGLGLAAIAAINSPDGMRIAVTEAGDATKELAQTACARFWCRRAEAERVAAAAARLVRGESNDAAHAATAVTRAAKRLGIALFSEQEIAAEAQKVAARIDVEMQRQKASGGLKEVNAAYRDYRIQTSARGERVLRYDEWMRKYKENLLRQVASALR